MREGEKRKGEIKDLIKENAVLIRENGGLASQISIITGRPI